MEKFFKITYNGSLGKFLRIYRGTFRRNTEAISVSMIIRNHVDISIEVV